MSTVAQHIQQITNCDKTAALTFMAISYDLGKKSKKPASDILEDGINMLMAGATLEDATQLIKEKYKA